MSVRGLRRHVTVHIRSQISARIDMRTIKRNAVAICGKRSHSCRKNVPLQHALDDVAGLSPPPMTAATPGLACKVVSCMVAGAFSKFSATAVASNSMWLISSVAVFSRTSPYFAGPRAPHA